MNKAELKTALETIVAALPIRTKLRCGDEVSYEDRFPLVREGANGVIVVSVDENATTGRKEAIEILNAVRRAAAQLPGAAGFRVTKKSSYTGFWHMSRFCETSRSITFFPADCTDRRFLAVAG